MMTARITDTWDNIEMTFVAVEDFGQPDLDRIAKKDSLTCIWVATPLTPAREAAIDNLPRTSYAFAFAVPAEIATTLEQFRDWMMLRLRSTDVQPPIIQSTGQPSPGDP